MAQTPKTDTAPATTLGAGTSNAPIPVTLVDTPAYGSSQPGPALITKVGKNGEEQSLPQAVWDALGETKLKEFSDKPAQPAKPADITK